MSRLPTALVVDDEDPVRTLIARRLVAWQWHVLEASSGAQALEIIESGADVDLLITDINMPGMSGILLVAQVLARLPKVKVLYVSGFTERLFAGGEWLRPGELYLEKPFTLASFQAALSTLGFKASASP